MALIKCRECGEEVSSEAKTCPHCGIKRPSEIKHTQVESVKESVRKEVKDVRLDVSD